MEFLGRLLVRFTHIFINNLDYYVTYHRDNITRIFAIPVLLLIIYGPFEMIETTKNMLATIVFVIASLTDWLDGWLARRLNQISSFGAFLDPVADKLMVCTVLIILVDLERWTLS